MKVDKYTLKSESNFTLFEFISEGEKGAIRKRIEFQEANEPNLYNLPFGDKTADTEAMDDLAVSNNGDTEKVLATVVSALYSFFDKNPEAFVYATGSTRSRTRLYQMGLSRFYKEMVQDFYLYGQVGENFYEFENGKNYVGFLAQRKFD